MIPRTKRLCCSSKIDGNITCLVMLVTKEYPLKI